MSASIDAIMDNFNFAKVSKAMEALDWKWYIPQEGLKVPEESDLRKAARRLLQSVEDYGDDYYCATGGFVAESKDGYLSLRFELASWDTSIY